MRIKNIILFAVIISLMLIVPSCNRIQEEEELSLTRNQKSNYALRWLFQFEGGYFIHHPGAIIFVHDEESAQGFGDDVQVGWPVHTLWLQGVLNGLNEHLIGGYYREGWTPEDYKDNLYNLTGLIHPITVGDLVDNYVAVHFVMREMLTSFDRIRNQGDILANPYLYPETPRIGIPAFITDQNQRTMLAKFNYAVTMRFNFRIVIDGVAINSAEAVRERINPPNRLHDPFFTEIILVHSREEAESLPDNIIAAWPRTHTLHPHLIDSLNQDHLSEHWHWFTLDHFGLRYPLILNDLVENWEKVDTMWTARTLRAQHDKIASLSSLIPYIPEEHDARMPIFSRDYTYPMAEARSRAQNRTLTPEESQELYELIRDVFRWANP